MTELQATVEFAIELCKFYNIDLYQRGILTTTTINYKAEEALKWIHQVCPLTVRNKAIMIEDNNFNVKGTIPAGFIFKPHEKEFRQRQFTWVELLDRNEDIHIRILKQKLEEAFKRQYNVTTIVGYEREFREFIFEFCFAIAFCVEDTNEFIDHFEYKNWKTVSQLKFLYDAVDPHIKIFYNALVVKEDSCAR